MMEARATGGHAMGAVRDLRGAPRFAAYAAVRELVLEDQRRRNEICWNVFDD